MKSQIYLAEVWHHRIGAVRHFFRYRLPCATIWLHELKSIPQENRLFRYNRRGVFSLRDEDYLGDLPLGTSLMERLEYRLREFGFQWKIAEVALVTVPRFFPAVFNPVSFYYCFDDQDALIGCVAEVNNTYGEKHLYILDKPEAAKGFLARFLNPKEFFVSPFYQREGEYEFLFGDIREKLDIRINVWKDGQVVFRAALGGSGREFTTSSTLRVLGKAPVHAALTFGRILYEAGKLFWKKLPVYSKPIPQSQFTIQAAKPHFSERLGWNFFQKLLRQSSKGKLTITLPNGEVHAFVGKNSGIEAELLVKEWKFFGRLISSGDIGVGEGYVEGDWTSSDMPKVLRYFADNFSAVRKKSLMAKPIRFASQIFRTLVRLNTRKGAQSNIQAHYDLGNEFFKLFLDPTMMYSSALFLKEGMSLEEAQLAKLDRLIERAQLKPEDHVLEIGTGWGSFACRAAEQIGCKVTSVTISKQQYAYAKEQVEKRGLKDLVEVRFCDYRDVKGTYTKIVSIEMLEAVGHHQLPVFFRLCDRVLAKDGLVVLQVITMPEQRYDTYRKSSDFIQKYIFPGAVVPSVGAIHQAATSSSGFLLERLENIGPDYADTLRIWRERLMERKDEVQAMGFDEYFIRLWEYYFAYCEAGFGQRILGNHHFVFTRANNLSYVPVK